MKILHHLSARLRGQALLELSNPSVSPRFHVGNRMEAHKIIDNDKEKELLEQFLSFIQPGDTVLDVGANIGLYTLTAALKTGENGHVHAFEPAPIWVKRLQENIALNKCNNVTAHEIAISNRDGSSDFLIKNVQGSGMGSISQKYNDYIDSDQVETIRVRLAHGDCYLQQHGIGVPNVIKIDVEGAEMSVLQGLEHSLRHPECRFLLCEVHPKFMPEPSEQVKQFLVESGFQCRSTEPGSPGPALHYHLFAYKSGE